MLRCRSRVSRAALLLSALLATPAAAAESGVTARGTAGLAPLRFAARNDGGEAMSCAVATAHWYSVDLGTAAPGATLRQTFWATPATGEIVILNAHGDRMPVQALWCGLAGRAWDTRAAIELERRAGRRPAPVHVACRAASGPLRCTGLPPDRKG
jgi:hypothetical protein